MWPTRALKAYQKGQKPKGVISLNAFFCSKSEENAGENEFTVFAYPKNMTCRAESEGDCLDWVRMINGD